MDHITKPKRKAHPEETANIVSVLTFFYTNKLFRKGFKKDLEEEDLYEVLSTLESKRLGDELEIEWENQKTKRKHLSVFRLLWTCYGWKYLFVGIIQLLVNTIIIMLQPKAQGKIASYFVPGQTKLTKYDAYFYGALLIVINIVSTLYAHNYYLMITALGIRIRTAFSSFIYRKALKLSPTRLSDISVGKVVTLITKDVQAFDDFVHFANNIWIGLLETIIICVLVYLKIGFAGVIGIGFLLLLMPLQIYCGIWAARLRMKMCQRTDERLQITQEMLSAIKIIKMYTWEKFFNKKVTTSRKKEIASMHNIFYLRFIVLAIGSINTKIAFYLLMMSYTWFGNHITAEMVFYVQSCFQILSYTLGILFPIGIGQTGELFTSAKRIGNVLKAIEIEESGPKTQMTTKPKVNLSNVYVTFKGKRILQDVTLSFHRGVTLIGGSVGSGKSFLLKTILQDFEPTKGSIEVEGVRSYASQEPWLFPSSIKQNILFGEPYNKERYQQVLDVCALRYDLELLSAGDSTIVEDRGMNLSKGQQARINLARAIYKEADIYLLDDCLSALDAHVTDYIFKECIKNYLKNKIVILVTHNTRHIKEVDAVIAISHGKIKIIARAREAIEGIEGFDIMDKTVMTEEKRESETEKDEDEKNEDTNENSTLITETTTVRKVYQEVKQEGQVDFAVYKKYIKFGGGFFIFVLVFLIYVVAQFFVSYIEILVSTWVNIEQELANYTLRNATETDEFLKLMEKRNFTLTIYAIVIGGAAFFTFTRSFALFIFARKASIRLHRYMLHNIVNASMHFFDTNFIGNILNRFSKDLTTIDETIPYVFYHLFLVLLHQAGISVLIISVNTVFVIPMIIFFILLVIVRRVYQPTGRSLKRMDSITRSPVIGHLNATLEGLTTIRAFKAENIVRYEFDRHQDLYTSATYTLQCSMRAFGFYLDVLCTIFISVVLMRFLFADKDTSAGNVGMAINQAFLMIGSLQWGIRQWAEVENQLTSVERVLEYTEVEQENDKGAALENWPTNGEVKYENVSLTYTNSTEKVLKNINFAVKPREKIGVVGRTGAGKSSIISTLFRLYEVEGKIMIDGVDIKTLQLSFLRSKISIIPQDPILFTGTIRDNIDPTGQYADHEIWKAIESSNLQKLVPDLDFEITDSGANFSVGQRQLICLARALIRNNKIIVLDEATANMDQETDAMIHETIHKNLSHCTVFTIAHKLRNILNSDKVMVLDKGEIIEYDHPDVLLKNRNGSFYRMVDQSGLLNLRM